MPVYDTRTQSGECSVKESRKPHRPPPKAVPRATRNEAAATEGNYHTTRTERYENNALTPAVGKVTPQPRDFWTLVRSRTDTQIAKEDKG